MWRSALAIVCLAVVAGCGGDDEQTASGGCTATVTWNDEEYFGTRHKRLPPPGDVLGDGEQPLCDDGGGGAEEQTREVQLRSVSGVPPEVAVYLADSPGDVYLNPGYLVELPSHPLHQVFYGPPGRPLRRARGKTCAFEGEIKSLDAFIVQAPDGEQWITVDARTRVEGFQREGLPYLRAGDRVRIKGKGCNEAVMLAQRIEPAA